MTTPELKPIDMNPATMKWVAGVAGYLALFGVLGNFWLAWTGTGWFFLMLGWLGVGFLITGLGVATPARAAKSKGFWAAVLSGVLIFGGAHVLNFMGAATQKVPMLTFFLGYTGTAALIACLALGRPEGAKTAGANPVVIIVQILLFWVLAFGLHLLVLAFLPYFHDHAVAGVACATIILSINIFVVAWVWRWLKGEALAMRLLVLLFALPLALDIIVPLYLWNAKHREEMAGAAETQAMRKAADITSYVEEPVMFPGLKFPVGLKMTIGMKSAQGNGQMQQPIFWRQPRGMEPPVQNFCCSGSITPQLGSLQTIPGLHPLEPGAVDNMGLNEPYGPLAMPFGPQPSTFTYLLFAPQVRSVTLDPPRLCFFPRGAELRDDKGELNARWYAFRTDVPERRNLDSIGFNVFGQQAHQPGGDIGPVLKDALIASKSALTDEAKWAELMDGVSMQTLPEAGYGNCNAEGDFGYCYCAPRE